MTARLRNLAALAALIGLALLSIGFVLDPHRAAFSYLVAYAFGFTIAVGALCLLMIGHASHAGWLIVLRRLLEAIAITVPLFALLFVPIALFAPRLYPWAAPRSTWTEHLTRALVVKGRWLTAPFFFGRAALYLAIWSALAVLLRRWSLADDARPDAERRQLARNVSGASLPVMGLTLTFAAFDWMMSTDPTWSSNIYGVYVFAGGFLAAIALVAILAQAARAHAIVPKEVSASHFHAVGNLMLAMTVFWAYIAFSQLLIVWIANLPEEVPFYAVRATGFWGALSIALGVGHFALPFLALLQRPLKRDGRSLAWIGAWLLLMHWLDLYWLLVPVAVPRGNPLHLADLGALLFVGGSAVAVGAWRFAAAAPVPTRDPGLADSLRFEMS
ncbi:MAG: hypothetical protein NVS3B10_01080 [Polyangiales bacterium]